MGLTEKQDLKEINAQLESITGITGINASYQYLYHQEITPPPVEERRPKS